jgi:hypothetical protein
MADTPSDARYERGIAIREEMLGPEHGRMKAESRASTVRAEMGLE